MRAGSKLVPCSSSFLRTAHVALLSVRWHMASASTVFPEPLIPLSTVMGYRPSLGAERPPSRAAA